MNLELLTKHYNEKDFALFIQSTFDIEVVEDIYRDAYLTQSERTQIDSYKFLGKTPRLSDKSILGFFSFRAKDKNIENKRVAFGDIIQTLARPYRLRHALVAIYHPESLVWRLSYVSFTIKDGELSLNTNLKRSTYVLGENIAIKTAKEQIGSLANVAITRENLENAFSVEAVTKEFYKGLVKEYENLLSHFLVYPNSDENSKKEFAIRLLGRILFIKFLNKKDFIPDTTFELCEGYYHEKLEPLFFEQLNTSKSERKKEFVDDGIPFLNGGLFEPLNLDFYEWSGVSSRYINMLTIDDKFFEALYRHLGEYNFTVDENSTEESELSIDPEMLGHIFENLLAEINAEFNPQVQPHLSGIFKF